MCARVHADNCGVVMEVDRNDGEIVCRAIAGCSDSEKIEKCHVLKFSLWLLPKY